MAEQPVQVGSASRLSFFRGLCPQFGLFSEFGKYEHLAKYGELLAATSGFVSGTHVSSIDIFRAETDENGDVNITHSINSWPALLDQFNKPPSERTAVIEGDVLLYKQRKHRNRAILMKAPPEETDRITFKQWLRGVIKLKKILKINVRSTEVVRPVLQYLLAAGGDIKSPVVLHANIFRSPRSFESVVDAQEFIEGTQKFYPDATLSIGWTRNNITEIPLHHRKFGWKEVFKILSLIKDVEQAVMVCLRLTVVVRSTEEISFLLGVREKIAVYIWSDESDVVDDWSGLASLRSGAYSSRLLFDMDKKHQDVLHSIPHTRLTTDYSFDKDMWRTVEFPVASSTTSGVIESNDGAVFLGWPNSFLISLQVPPAFPSIQYISSKLTFVTKKYVREDEELETSGLAVYLVEKVMDITSPEIVYGIKVFIGHRGEISIENRDPVEQQHQSRVVGQLTRENCYYFELIDRGWRVELSIWHRICGTDERSERTYIYLDTPMTKTRRLRNVIVSKIGDGKIDMLLQGLKHNSSAKKSTLSTAILVLLLRIFCYHS